MLPTPAKFHYVFNLRDLSRIWQGMLYGCSEVVHSEGAMLKLWKHECTRVIADRFIDEAERDWLDKIIMQVSRDDLYDIMDKEVLNDTNYFVNFLR